MESKGFKSLSKNQSEMMAILMEREKEIDELRNLIYKLTKQYDEVQIDLSLLKKEVTDLREL